MTDGISSSFHRLDPRIQRFIWAEGWESLRDAPKAAIPLIVQGDRDVIVAASTAAGNWGHSSACATRVAGVAGVLPAAADRLYVKAPPTPAWRRARPRDPTASGTRP